MGMKYTSKIGKYANIEFDDDHFWPHSMYCTDDVWYYNYLLNKFFRVDLADYRRYNDMILHLAQSKPWKP